MKRLVPNDLTAAERQGLVESHQWLAYHLAVRYIRAGLTLDELVSAANEGLCYAAAHYDPSRGCKFNTYAYTWVRNRLVEEYRSGVIRTDCGLRSRVPEMRGRAEGAARVMSLSGCRRAGGEVFAYDVEAPKESGPSLHPELADAIDRLPDRLRTVVRSRLGRATLREIGRALGVTKERARQLEGVAHRMLRADMADRERTVGP